MDKFNDMFKVDYQDVSALQEGTSYPFYGAITSILEENSEGIVTKFEINRQIVVNIFIDQNTKIFSDKIKDRVFEPGIFIGTYIGKLDDKISINCSTIVFGKKDDMPVQ